LSELCGVVGTAESKFGSVVDIAMSLTLQSQTNLNLRKTERRQRHLTLHSAKDIANSKLSGAIDTGEVILKASKEE
jgi:hypothetical protein